MSVLTEEEALALRQAGREGATVGPLLEAGTFCGPSAVYLGAAAEEEGTELFTVDVGLENVAAAIGPFGLVFIDGPQSADADYERWAPHVALGGLLAIHDVVAEPAGEGRSAFEVYCRALEGGEFAEIESARVGTLRVLQRVRPT